MLNPFEDVNREYINRYSETNGILLADSYESFVDKMLSAIQETLNNTEPGYTLTQEALRSALNRGATPEQWQQEKCNIMRLFFFLALESSPYLKHEFCHHLYNHLRGGNSNA